MPAVGRVACRCRLGPERRRRASRCSRVPLVPRGWRRSRATPRASRATAADAGPPSRRSCRRRRWPRTAASCAARSLTPCSSTCRPCRASAGAALPRPSWPAGRQAAGQRAQGHRQRDAGRAARAGLRGRCSARGSRAEVAIVAEVPTPTGRRPALRLAGKIDRLVQDGDSILIVDYKTNRPPPTDVPRLRRPICCNLPPTGWLSAAFSRRACQGRHSLDRRAAESWKFRRLLDEPQQRLWQLDPASLDA